MRTTQVSVLHVYGAYVVLLGGYAAAAALAVVEWAVEAAGGRLDAVAGGKGGGDGIGYGAWSAKARDEVEVSSRPTFLMVEGRNSTKGSGSGDYNLNDIYGYRN